MRLSWIREYLALRRHLVHPAAFLWKRKRPLPDGYLDVPFRGGYSIRLRDAPMDRHIFHRIFARDEYRLDGVAPGSWETVVDVGAHIGLFAARVAPLTRRLLCFEPDPGNGVLLRRNLAAPSFMHVIVTEGAVSDHAGRQRFHPSDNPSASSFFAKDASAGDGIEVTSVTLEEVFARHRIEQCDLLKLDCEGAEYGIVETAPPGLWKRVRRIAMEYHPVEGRPDWTSGWLEGRFEASGHRCEVIPAPKDPRKGRLFSERAV